MLKEDELLDGVKVIKYEGDPPPPRYERQTLCFVPKSLWLEHRARELADHICRLLDVPEPDIAEAKKITVEMCEVLRERKRMGD